MLEDKNQNLERFSLFVKTLQEALKMGYDVSFDERSSFGFSPVNVLLEAMIDILLIIRKLFSIGAQGPGKNPGLKFSERFSDSLGNPKQIRINYPRDYFWDPAASDIFMQLASTFIQIKNQESVKKSFHDFFDRIDFKSSKKFGVKNKKIHNRNNYWRRHRSKKYRS